MSSGRSVTSACVRPDAAIVHVREVLILHFAELSLLLANQY
jgi:hypothetical protein